VSQVADAFAAALRTWPDRGVPGNPGAWLLTAARHRQTDAARRRQTHELSEEHLRIMAEEIEHASQTADEITATAFRKPDWIVLVARLFFSAPDGRG
jgi:predicted RNA polymerase sigma factor